MNYLEQKRKEIKEWLGRKFCLTMGSLDYSTPVGKRLGDQFANSILIYLHSQGVVLKVEVEWDIGEVNTDGIPCNPLCHNMERKLLKEAGYTTTAPLIEEK